MPNDRRRRKPLLVPLQAESILNNVRALLLYLSTIIILVVLLCGSLTHSGFRGAIRPHVTVEGMLRANAALVYCILFYISVAAARWDNTRDRWRWRLMYFLNAWTGLRPRYRRDHISHMRLDRFRRQLVSRGSEASFTVFIRGLSSRSVSVQVDFSSTLSDVVVLLQKRRLLPSAKSPDSSVHRFHSGSSTSRFEILMDERLVDKGIGPLSTLDARTRVLGGSLDDRKKQCPTISSNRVLRRHVAPSRKVLDPDNLSRDEARSVFDSIARSRKPRASGATNSPTLKEGTQSNAALVRPGLPFGGACDATIAVDDYGGTAATTPTQEKRSKKYGGLVYEAPNFSLEVASEEYQRTTGLCHDDSDDECVDCVDSSSDPESGLDSPSLGAQESSDAQDTTRTVATVLNAGERILIPEVNLDLVPLNVSSTPNPDLESTAGLPMKKRKRSGTGTAGKRSRNSESRAAYKSKRNKARRKADRLNGKEIPLDTRIFAKSQFQESVMHPNRVKRQGSAFLATPCTLDKMEAFKSNDISAEPSKELPNVSAEKLNERLGLHKNCDPEVARLIEKEGYRYVRNIESEAQAVVDEQGKIFFVKAKRPSDWNRIFREVSNTASRLCEKVKALDPEPTSNRHVTPELCLQIMFGMIFPQGGKAPACQNVPSDFRPLVDEVLNDPWVIQYMNHVTRCFRTWFPRHAFVYKEAIDRLQLDGNLQHDMFPNSLFCGTTFNLGPYGVTRRHRDSRNLVGGLCMIGVFGDFDHRTSGHFIMEEAKTIVELRAGDIVFMPSAAVTHWNSKLREGERRSSIVQYTSGGIFRWIWQGKKVLSKKEMKMKADIRRSQGCHRWRELYELFPSIDELENAKQTGRMALGDIKVKISEGNSLLFPPL